MKFVYPSGATPLNPDELEGLLLAVSTQRELNELEKANIRRGVEWAKKSRKIKKILLTYTGLMRLHKELLGNVWQWAGSQRKSEKNIGIHPHQITEEIGKLCTDTQFWIDNKTYEWDEIGVRFHHRLVFVHPFVNGNGRLARIATDLIFTYNNCQPFTWGSDELVTESEVRKMYIATLKEADGGNYIPLMKFVRT